MDGFALLCGHLVGDYIVQNDWMAKNKSNQYPSQNLLKKSGNPVVNDLNWDLYHILKQDWWVGHIACLIHCILYTLAIWAFSFWWMPWWGLLICFALHFPIDRWRLARRWMEYVAFQKAFASGPLSPWSIIIVDNTFHLLTLFGIAALTRRV